MRPVLACPPPSKRGTDLDFRENMRHAQDEYLLSPPRSLYCLLRTVSRIFRFPCFVGASKVRCRFCGSVFFSGTLQSPKCAGNTNGQSPSRRNIFGRVAMQWAYGA